ncbi:MAG TPA: pilus assembly protein TadE [Propionicimonas sp.]|nr:pilus assembly protein TadE [Propionicimonas sp.]
MRDQRGLSLSPFLVILLPALLVMIGLVVDGGAQAAAARHAERVAASAARAGSDAAAADRLSGGQDGARVALTVARRVVDQDAAVSGSVKVVDNAVVVTTRMRTPTAVLSLIGIGEVVGEGSARSLLTADR